jgi:hypothetical protein
MANLAVIGTIDQGAKTIALTVPYGTSVTALVPTITITGASVSPDSGWPKTSPTCHLYRHRGG